MIRVHRNIVMLVVLAFLSLLFSQGAGGYEVAPSLGSTAGVQPTIDMGDRSKWPMVAELSWGPLANLVPIARLSKSQQQAVFGNFKGRLAIAELPYRSINWGSSQPDINYIESFGFTVPYVFVLDGSAGDSMLTKEELERVVTNFPDKKIIMNTYSWADDHEHVESVENLLDGVCVEYFPHNARSNIAKHVAPFAGWAYKKQKILMFLMPPLPDETNFSYWVTELARIVYEENSDLPQGWMASDNFIFSPANYTFGASSLTYVPEDAENTVLGAAKALLMMRPQLDAGPVWPEKKTNINNLILLLLRKK